MITIETLGQLPYKTYSVYLFKTEEDAIKKAGERESYLYIQPSPKCVLLFVYGVKEIHEIDNN